MDLSSLNWTDLILSTFCGVGTSLLATSVAYLFLKPFREKPKAVVGIMAVGLAFVLSGVFFLYFSDTLVEVPDLALLSRAEAEEILARRGLLPDPKPQHHEKTSAGRVIPKSQNPEAGLKVRKGTRVEFSVAVQTPTPLSEEKASQIAINLLHPRTHERVVAKRYPDNVYRFRANGTTSGLLEKYRLLLWVRPIDPPSETPGWYLQRAPMNGIIDINVDGTWSGFAQIGNSVWPPNNGDTVDIAVTVANVEDANNLLSDPGVVTRNSLPGRPYDIAQNVTVRLE
ncbi:MAG: PASTA domain-containing protein [Aestuariibacter sp.]|nr:PASTA domain-containing protein [Aestuariibacter sp.]